MDDEIAVPAGAGIAGRLSAMFSCSLCGASLHRNQLVPDGGPACDDVRWYCRDVRGCTQRWTAPRMPRQARAAEVA
jgi:hypothetical protein